MELYVIRRPSAWANMAGQNDQAPRSVAGGAVLARHRGLVNRACEE